jgi:hypothetical protein
MTTEQKSFFASPTQQVEVTPLVVPSLIVLSAPLKVDLSVYRGDSGGFRISVKDNLNAPVNVSTATWDGDIRLTAVAPTVLTSFTIVPVSGDTSSVDVELSPASSALLSANCVYDIEMTLNGKVTTLIYGAIAVTQDVSRT